MKSRNILLALPCALLSLSAMAEGTHVENHDDSAIGKPGVASKVTRTVTVDMKDDMRFHSSNFNSNKVKQFASSPRIPVWSSTKWWTSRSTTKSL